jgi:hypothetical protein
MIAVIYSTFLPNDTNHLLGNNKAEEEEINNNTITTQEYNVETPKPEKNHDRCLNRQPENY